MLRSLLAVSLSLGLLASFVTHSQAADHKLTAENTSIKFVGAKPSGDSHTGSFKKLNGVFNLADDITKSKLEVVIELESIETDAAGLTAHLKTPDFFDVRQFPQAKFVSKELKVDGDKTILTGDLTMHGKTESVSFPIKVEKGDLPKLTAEFEIARKKWGMTYGQGQINENTKVTISFDASKKSTVRDAAPAAPPAKP